MKVEVDENYCCNEIMESKNVIDVNTNKERVLFVCRHCKMSFELDTNVIKNAEIRKRDPIMSP